MEEINKIKRFRNKNLIHTRSYLLSLSIEDLKKLSSGVLHKNDIIEQYYLSRKDKKFCYEYDFSQVPDIVNNKNDKFLLGFYKRKNNSTLETVKDFWKTSYKSLVINGYDNKVIAGYYNDNNNSSKYFIELSEKKFGKGIIKYDKVNYINRKIPVILGCPRCGEYYKITPDNHLSKHTTTGLCPNCRFVHSSEIQCLGISGLIDRCNSKYGMGVFEFPENKYVNYNTEILVKNNITGEKFYTTPNKLLYNSPTSFGNSKGEQFVLMYLVNNNIIHSKQTYYYINNRKIFIDFTLEINDKLIWIEYDGEQHYRNVEYFKISFENQLERDVSIYNYSIDNNIYFIKIPYTYNTFQKVCGILEKTLLNTNIDPFTIIKYPKIKYPDCYTGERIQYGK